MICIYIIPLKIVMNNHRHFFSVGSTSRTRSYFSSMNKNDDHDTTAVEEYNYRDPLAIFVPVSSQSTQPINHTTHSSTSSFKKSKRNRGSSSHHRPNSIATIGPYKLGENIILRCVSRGGQPLPNVSWWRDNVMLGNVFIGISFFGIMCCKALYVYAYLHI